MFLLAYIGISKVSLDTLEGKNVIRWAYSEVPIDSVKIFRADGEHPKESPLLLGVFTAQDTLFVDTSGNPDAEYVLRTFVGKDSSDTDWLKVGSTVEISPPKKGAPAPKEERAAPKEERRGGIHSFFDVKKTNILIALLLFTAIFFWLLEMARRNPNVFIRRIAGLDVIDDAVGRSAEMGKPIMFTTGIGTISDLAILAGITVLKQVAKRAALYEVPVLVPNNDPLVLAAAREAVREAYIEMGRPDLYRENDIFFLTTSQFGFASGMSGMMNRIKPGAVFFMGYFYAESLILAENAYVSGAISVAGTVSIDQLPFFIAACDYTIIGDELYAASAYISRNPLEVAGVKAGDWFKAMSIIFILIGVALATAAQLFPEVKPLYEGYRQLFSIGR
ncbi:MAG: hypothetical protein GXO29_02260 [Thermotogae bacterium]|nr:hypothetical protein [Thermotogota bacterium]